LHRYTAKLYDMITSDIKNTEVKANKWT